MPAPPRGLMEGKGELPSDFPDDVPQYPGSKVTEARGTLDAGIAVTFDSPDSIETITKFYEDSLAAMGWQTQTQPTEEGTMVLGDKEDKILAATIQGGGQGTLVEMIIGRAE